MRYRLASVFAVVAVLASQSFAGPDTLPSLPILIPIQIIRFLFGF